LPEAARAPARPSQRRTDPHLSPELPAEYRRCRCGQEPLVDIRVLVVDDEPELCELTRSMLARAGYEAEGLTDPRQVVDKLREREFHLVVLDMMMPELDGTRVLEQIRKVDSDLAVVVATAHPSLENAVSSLRLAASDFVAKPFRAEELVDTV